MQEGAYKIESLPMVNASRKTKTIVARPPMYQDQLLKPIVNSEKDDSEDIFEDGLFKCGQGLMMMLIMLTNIAIPASEVLLA